MKAKGLKKKRRASLSPQERSPASELLLESLETIARTLESLVFGQAMLSERLESLRQAVENRANTRANVTPIPRVPITKRKGRKT